MNCERCSRPASPRVYQLGKDIEGNPIMIDESGVGGRQSLPGECNRRSATGLVQCMELELNNLRSIRTAQEQTITKMVEDTNVLKKTVLELQFQLGLAETALAKSGSCQVSHLAVFYKEFSERFKHWTIRTFGKEVWFNKQERALRLLEETFELCQASGIPTITVQILLDRTYRRPVGELSQEVTGVFNCILAFAASQSLDLPVIYEKEVKRLEEGSPTSFRVKQQLKYEDGVGLYPNPQVDY